MDVSDTIIAKSDQLNADDLIAGPVDVTVVKVGRGDADQPVSIEITKHKPYKPCKSMRRVLVIAWGKDASQWVGKSMRLIRDPDVKWAGSAVGGIRIAAMSHIKSKLEIALTVTRGKKAPYVVDVLAGQQKPPAQNDNAKRIALMKDVWKSARTQAGLPSGIDDFGAFVEQATSGLVLAKESLSSTAFSEEALSQCEQAAVAMQG